MADYNIHNLKFLVVDDDANMRQLIRTILGSLSVNAIEVVSGTELGFALLENFPPISPFVTLGWNP